MTVSKSEVSSFQNREFTVKNITIERRDFIAKVGGIAAFAAMSSDAIADEIEHQLEGGMAQAQEAAAPAINRRRNSDYRRGSGRLFRVKDELPPMPDKPTLIDFFNYRFTNNRHCFLTAQNALDTGQPERNVMASLLHDCSQTLCVADHGYWGGQLFEPYVDERISWAIRYHQALRFFADEEAGYEYPELYNRIFGKGFVPEDYIFQDYEMVRNHKWYMEARLITVNDQYGFTDGPEVSLDPFIDIIGRNFKEPKEGLGYDNSPSAHMWRTMINPDRAL